MVLNVIHYEGRFHSGSMGKTDLEEQYDKIYRYCYFKVHQREAAEDITQEAFLRFYERFGHYGSEFTLQYLYRIAHNLCVDKYRKGEEAELPEELAREGHEEQVLLRVMLGEALAGLPEVEKELLLLRYVNEVPVAVICKLYGISRFTLHRKLKKVTETLERMLE